MCDLDFINTISSTFSSEINKFIQSFTLTIKQQFENIDKKILGFGHPSIKGQDERVLSLKGNFKHLFSDHTNFCLRMENRIPVPMNIGCIIASLSLDNGISAKNCLFLPLLGRMLGWLKLYNKTQKKFNKVVPSFENIKNES